VGLFLLNHFGEGWIKATHIFNKSLYAINFLNSVYMFLYYYFHKAMEVNCLHLSIQSDPYISSNFENEYEEKGSRSI